MKEVRTTTWAPRNIDANAENYLGSNTIVYGWEGWGSVHKSELQAKLSYFPALPM